MAELATIARPYAEALFSSAQPTDLASWSEQLSELAQIASAPELVLLVNNPQVSAADLSQLIVGIAKTKVSEKVLSFLRLLNQNQRLGVLSEIAAQFNLLKNQSEGAADVMITSAFPIEGEALSSLLASLKKRFGGKELRSTILIDPSLIGGIRVQVGDEVLDGSVKARLAQMQMSLSA